MLTRNGWRSAKWTFQSNVQVLENEYILQPINKGAKSGRSCFHSFQISILLNITDGDPEVRNFKVSKGRKRESKNAPIGCVNSDFKQTNFDIPLCAINIVSVFIQLLTLCKLANSSFFPPPSKVHQGNTSLCTYRYLHGSASQLGSVS